MSVCTISALPLVFHAVWKFNHTALLAEAQHFSPEALL